jgi:hypothetical protein
MGKRIFIISIILMILLTFIVSCSKKHNNVDDIQNRDNIEISDESEDAENNKEKGENKDVEDELKLILFCENSKYGFKDSEGNIIINPIYDYALEFHQGLATVKLGNKWGYINKEGKKVIDFVFDNALSFSEGIAAVRVNGEWGYIDKKGNIIIEPQFDSYNSFTEGKVKVRIGGKYGTMDKKGKIAWTKCEIYREGQVFPRDEADKNSEFKKFLDQLMVAIEEKDVDFIKKHIDDNILFDFGYDPGVENFYEKWELNKNPDKSTLWRELYDILKLGGVFIDENKTNFEAPYIWVDFPRTYDGFEYGAITDKNIKVYSKANIESDVICELNYNIVKVIEWHIPIYDDANQVSLWSKVQLPSGERGYVIDEYIRSPIDYRIGIMLKNGVWKINMFIAGD